MSRPPRFARALPALLVLTASALVTGLALAAGGEAHDAGGEHHAGIDPKTFALQLLNFGVLLFILIKFGGGAINKALRKRHDTLKSDLEESTRLRVAAEAKLAEQEKRLINLAAEIAALRTRMKQDAEAERIRLVASAEEKAKRVGEETQLLLAQQIKQAEIGFRAEVAAAAARIAEELVRRSVGPDDQRRLADDFVTDLGSLAASGGKAGGN